VDTPIDTPPGATVARDIVVTGRVQGVGYRPFVYRLADELGVAGTVLNGSGKVFIHAEATGEVLDRLERDLVARAPPLAQPRVASSTRAAAGQQEGFAILPSEAAGRPEIHVPPDLFTCEDCLAEMSDPAERRFRYPFINCTQCGPRYTIITAMPYDRPNTSMRGFGLCRDCRREYDSPLDRRFHAQPLACPVCGPGLEFVPANSKRQAFASAQVGEADLQQALGRLRAGDIIAVKGVGGYHLLCDAASETAVRRLRRRKGRPHKPLAVMFPLRGADGLDAVRNLLDPGPEEQAALADPARPIVLVAKSPSDTLAPSLAPGLRELGAFLPYSPLHHLLLDSFGAPLVATSGNLSGEPVLTARDDAERGLGAVADGFLHHDRPIVRPADDSVVRVVAGRARPVRLGRGLAPLEMHLDHALEKPLIATGGHMKNTVALAWEDRVVVSPHIGELDSPRSQDIFARVIADLQALYGVRARCIATDRHPGYAGSRWARDQALPVIPVQHHAAHASALAGEHPDIRRWLVFTWDGVGRGDDGTLWGGEALAGGPGEWRRRASFRPFVLGGGDRAGREPWRSAAALLWAMGWDWLPEVKGAPLARQAWARRANCHTTTAAGRLFDAAACLVLGRELASYEGQGPMELEAAARDGGEPVSLPLRRAADGLWRTDWEPLVPLLAATELRASRRAALFHASLAQALVDQARMVREEFDFDAVGLTGGVFQNRLLCELASQGLAGLGLPVRLHRQVPANDGGLSFGQVIEARAVMDRLPQLAGRRPHGG